MSRRNSRFQKAVRREQREQAKENARRVHEGSLENPMWNRKDRRGRRG